MCHILTFYLTDSKYDIILRVICRRRYDPISIFYNTQWPLFQIFSLFGIS